MDLISSYLRHIRSLITGKVGFKIFLLLFFSVFLPLVIILSLSYRYIILSTDQDFETYKTVLCHQISNNIDNNFDLIKNESESLVYNVKELKTVLPYQRNNTDDVYVLEEKDLGNQLYGILLNNHRYDAIGIIDQDGYIVKYINGDGLLPKEYLKDKDGWMEKAKQAKGRPILTFFDWNDFTTNSEEIDRKIVTVCSLINNPDEGNKPLGFYCFCQSSEKFGEIVVTGMLEKEETAVITDPGGNVVYSSSQFGYRSSDRLALEGKAAGGWCELEGKTYFLIKKESEKSGFNTYILIPESSLAEKYLPLKSTVVLIAILLIFLSFFIAVLLSRAVSRPLNRLMAAFNELKSGNFETSVAVKGNDEFAQISNGFNLMVQNINALIREKYAMEIQYRQAELESLQSKINPHFLYNTLALTEAVIQKGDRLVAGEILQNLSELFRYSLAKESPLVSLFDELEHVKKYIFIQEKRFRNKIRFLLEIDPETYGVTLLRLTIQPIVENAIVHGFCDNSREGSIEISSKVFRDECCIYICDNGAGISKAKLDKINRKLKDFSDCELSSAMDGKIGIYNVNARIKLYFGRGYGLQVFSEESRGTTVKIILPACQQEDRNEDFSGGGRRSDQGNAGGKDSAARQ